MPAHFKRKEEKQQMKEKKRIIGIILVVFWMITVFCFSNQNSTKSSNTSRNAIRFMVRKVATVPQEQEEDIIEGLQHVVRKLAHFSIYTIGGMLLLSLVKTYTNQKPWLYAWFLGTGYAITDEIHQYFVPGRSCEVRDVMIDSSGVITGIIVMLVLGTIIRKVRKSKT